MIYRKFVKIMWWTSRELRIMSRLISKYWDITRLLNKLQYHFTAEERLPIVIKSLKAENSDEKFVELLRSI